MTALLDSLYPGDDVTLLVFNVLIQITAVILLTMLVVRRFLRRSAAAGHAAWLGCLAFVAACPLITFAADRAGTSIVSLPVASETTTTTQTEVSAAPSPVATTTIATAHPAEPQPAVPGKGPSHATFTLKPPVPPTAERLAPAEDTRFETTDRVTPPETERRPHGLQPAAAAAPTTPGATGPLSFRSAVSIAVAIWATGALLLSVRLLHGGLYLRKLGRTTTPLDESALADVLKRVRHSLGVTSLPRILLSEQITTPVVAALPRPTILLPASLPESISRDSLHDVLVHECAHVVRCDHWVGVLQRLVEIVYWPHPLIHHMNRQVARCREEVCDNHVLSGVGSTDYADTLLELTVRCQNRVGMFSSIGMFRLHWQLADRVRGLLDGQRDQRVRLGNRSRLAMLVSACVVLAAAATLQIDLAAEENENKPLAARTTTAGEKKRADFTNIPATREDETLVEGILVDESGKPPADARVRSVATLPDGKVLDVDGNPRKPGHDLDGEPLPRGAVARLGSRRLRHEGWYKRAWMLPDNKTLISSSPDNGVRLWGADTGKLLRELDLEGKRLTAIDLSHDAKSLAVLTRKIDIARRESTCEVRLWDTSTWQARPIAAWTGSISDDDERVAVTPDATTVATGNERGKIRFWDVASGEELLEYSVAQRAIESLAFSPDGALVAIATRDGVFLWDWLSGDAPKALEGPVERTQIVTFAPDGRLLAAGCRDAFAARIWDVASRQLTFRLKGEADDYYREGLTFSSDGKSLIVPGSETKTVEIFDVQTGQLRRSLDTGCLEPRDVAISTDGRLLTAIGSRAAIKLWALPDARCLSDQYVGHAEAAYEIQFTPDGRHVITGCLDETIRVWEADTGRQRRSLGPHGWVSGLAVSYDGKKIASCSHDETVRLWDLESGREIFRLPGHGRLGGNNEYVVGFDRTAARFFSFGPNLYLRVWSTQTGKALTEHAIRPSGIEVEETEEGTLRLADPSASRFGGGGGLSGVLQHARLTADGDRLFLSDRQSIYVFDVESGREIDTWKPQDSLNNFHVSPDASRLVTVESRRPPPDPTEPDPQPSRTQYLLKEYRLPSKEKVREIELPGSVTQALAFSADGRLVATGIHIWKRYQPTRRWISVWDLETGDEVAHVDGYDNQAYRVAFSPDGKRLASTHNDTTILVWDLEQFRVERPKQD
ncbi:MAG: M56 family metallopeptidase [Planctomycetota bacterium]|jgi:WD40 repeat protein/beta-lactamase regulating signal transducer with metallopeptidase domain